MTRLTIKLTGQRRPGKGTDMTDNAKPAFAGMSEALCSRNWWVEEYDEGKFRIMAGDNRAVMCRGDGYLSREYAKRMGAWMFEHGSHPGPANMKAEG